MIPRRAFLGALPLLAACRKAGKGYQGFAFVSSESEPSLVAVDLLSFAVKSRLTLPGPATSLHLHKNHLFALSPAARALSAIDAKGLAVKQTLKLPAAPLTAIRRGSTLWCLMANPAQILPVSLETMRPAQPIPLPSEPLAFDIAWQVPLACVTLAKNSVVFADLAGRIVHPPRLLDDVPGAVRFRTDDKAAFIAGLDRRQLIVLDVRSRDVMTQLPLSLSPDHFCMSADGGQLFITGRGRDAVAIAYTYRTEIAQTSLSGRKPGLMATSAEPPLLFVANPEAGSVTIFDIMSQKVLALTSVGLEPQTIEVTPDQQFALVLNRASGDLAVIRIAAIAPDKDKTAPLFTMIPVGPKPASIVVATA
ncbi:MAG: hypothetical protein HY821_15480 [Acidobacteria bacterium]|nr:hypothetical protein [Acidobacteriota bacterium]